MARDVSYQEAFEDLEADIGRRVMSGDDDGLSDEMLAKRWDDYRKGRDLTYYPSRTLELLHADERMIRGVMGPVGCIAGDARIYTRDGLQTIKELYDRREGFDVLSLRPDGSVGWERATAPFVKGCEPLVELGLSNGRFIKVARSHRVLTAVNGWIKCDEGVWCRYIKVAFEIPRDDSIWDYHVKLRVESVREMREAETFYDLTVETTENYIGEFGLVHHNSGKTTGIIADMNMRHFRQLPCRDDVVRDKFALVRGTLALLNATLVDTWIKMFPKTRTFGSKYGVCGMLTRVMNKRKYELEIRGFGLDKRGALNNLLSNNFSGGIINEAVTISEEAKDGVFNRCGRFPDIMDAPSNFQDMPGAWVDRDGYPRWFKNHGVSMDTNAASEDTWWYRKSRDGDVDPAMEVYYDQPPAAFKIWNDEKEKWEYELNNGQRPGIPKAENIEHLQEHWDYYRKIIKTSSHANIDRYVCCIYSKTEVGTPVFGDFHENWHIGKNGVPWPSPGTRMFGGMDFGQTRRAVLAYISPEGRLMVFAEAIDATGSVENFADNVLRPMLAQHGFSVGELTLYCDPAALNRSEHSPLCGVMLMRGRGFDAVPPANLVNNSIETRLEAVRHFLTRIIGSKGALQIDPGCTHLIRSIGGGYVWKRRKIAAEYMDDDTPAKNNHSHIADAFQYLCCGIRWGGDLQKIGGLMSTRQYERSGNLYLPKSDIAGMIDPITIC